MATVLDLFKQRQNLKTRDLYGLAGTTYIESRGIINPGRAAALALSSPNAIADIVGSQSSGIIGGNANRPDDTIFKNNQVFSKPITLLATTPALTRDAVERGERYYVKPSPIPGNIIKNVVDAFDNPSSFITMGAMAVTKFGSAGAVRRVGELLRKKGDADGYGTKFMTPNNDPKASGMIKDTDIKYTTHYTLFKTSETNNNQWSRAKTNRVAERKNTKMLANNSSFDSINDFILSTMTMDVSGSSAESDAIQKKLKESNPSLDNSGYVYVAMKLYGGNQTIILPGVISGISEEFSPEINTFKYIGSPFNLYKYAGVERSLRFELKLYALDAKHEVSLRSNLDSLRELVFPSSDISTVTYADNTYSPLYFNPNLIELTINGLYNNILGIVDTLSISVDDTIPWASSDFLDADNSTEYQHPTVFNVSFGMKIIERPSITKDTKGSKYNFRSSFEENNKYVNYFTGYGYSGKKDKIQTNSSYIRASSDLKSKLVKPETPNR